MNKKSECVSHARRIRQGESMVKPHIVNKWKFVQNRISWSHIVLIGRIHHFIECLNVRVAHFNGESSHHFNLFDAAIDFQLERVCVGVTGRMLINRRNHFRSINRFRNRHWSAQNKTHFVANLRIHAHTDPWWSLHAQTKKHETNHRRQYTCEWNRRGNFDGTLTNGCAVIKFTVRFEPLECSHVIKSSAW